LKNEIEEYDNNIHKRTDYRYRHLEQYDENELMQVFSIELILRYHDYHKILEQETFCERLDSESEEEFDIRMDLCQFERLQKLDEQTTRHFGLLLGEISRMYIMHPYNDFTQENDEVTILIRCPSQTSIINIDLDLNLSEEELIAIVLKHKKSFDDNSKVIDFFKRVNDIYADKIQVAFTDFPIKFSEKRKAIIDALFIFDYIQDRQNAINELNEEAKNSYKESEASILKDTLTDEKNKKRKLKEIQIEYKNSLIKMPSFNTSSKNSYFTEELFQQSKIPSGTAKKYFYIIKNLITNTLP